MTSVSMRCFEFARHVRSGLLLLCCLVLVGPVLAHKGSDAYLQLKLDAASSTLRVDLALRDLDAVLEIDADADGQLTWGEIRTAWPAIERYLAARVQVDGCQWTSVTRTLERRADGVYAALTWSGACASTAVPPVIRYTALREIDPTHRAIAKIERSGVDAVVQVLDPTRQIAAAETPKASAVSGLSAALPSVAGAASIRSADNAAAVAATSDSPSAAEHASAGFVREGMRHILTGYDHMLFLLCLLLPAVMRRTPTGWQPVERLSQAIMPVAVIVTAFTVAHSVTLTLAGLKLASLPSSFIEPAIAVTIILAAVDNVWPIFRGRRAVVTFLFGLIHGFGFAGVLGELDLPPTQFAWALLQFNLGIELGQLFIVTIAVSCLYLFRQNGRYPRWVIQGGSAAAICIGALWLIERTADVSILRF
ncbi:MAG: HupE/UreJ family protein [Pseudomonadota bacterium]|nr:HupE/UreJ family protein [Pseudomonadota bacterium]